MALAAALTLVLAGWTIALARGPRWPLGVAAAGALLGTLAKGPVALVLPGLAAAPFIVTNREAWRRIRPLAVLGVAAGLAALSDWAAFRGGGGAVLAGGGRANRPRVPGPAGAVPARAHRPARPAP